MNAEFRIKNGKGNYKLQMQNAKENYKCKMQNAKFNMEYDLYNYTTNAVGIGLLVANDHHHTSQSRRDSIFVTENLSAAVLFNHRVTQSNTEKKLCVTLCDSVVEKNYQLSTVNYQLTEVRSKKRYE